MCCRDLIRSVKLREKNFKQGLHLFPGEKKHLRELTQNKYGLKILPKWRGLPTKEVIAYQLVNEPCPFLQADSCSIYANRPLICHLFPRNAWGGVDKSCTWVKKHNLDKPLEEVFIISDQLKEAFSEVVSKIHEQITSNDLDKIILYNFRGKREGNLSVKNFLTFFRRWKDRKSL